MVVFPRGARSWLPVLALLCLLSGCGGDATRFSQPSQLITTRVTVLGVDRPLAGVRVSYYEGALLGVTGNDGGVTVTVNKGTRLGTEAFGFNPRTFTADAAEVTVIVQPADDVELTELYADSVGVVKDGDTVYYPTTLRASGRYRSVSYPWPQKVTFDVEFDDWRGAIEPDAGGPLPDGRWAFTRSRWEPCTYTVQGATPVCTARHDRSGVLRVYLRPPSAGLRGTVVKSFFFKLTFVRR